MFDSYWVACACCSVCRWMIVGFSCVSWILGNVLCFCGWFVYWLRRLFCDVWDQNVVYPSLWDGNRGLSWEIRGLFHKNTGTFRYEICVVEQLCDGKQVLKWRIVQITRNAKRVDATFSYKTRSVLSLKPTVGDFIALVFCESVKLASLGRQYRGKQAPYVTGNFPLSFGVSWMKSRGANLFVRSVVALYHQLYFPFE